MLLILRPIGQLGGSFTVETLLHIESFGYPLSEPPFISDVRRRPCGGEFRCFSSAAWPARATLGQTMDANVVLRRERPWRRQRANTHYRPRAMSTLYLRAPSREPLDAASRLMEGRLCGMSRSLALRRRWAIQVYRLWYGSWDRYRWCRFCTLRIASIVFETCIVVA